MDFHGIVAGTSGRSTDEPRTIIPPLALTVITGSFSTNEFKNHHTAMHGFVSFMILIINNIIVIIQCSGRLQRHQCRNTHDQQHLTIRPIHRCTMRGTTTPKVFPLWICQCNESLRFCSQHCCKYGWGLPGRQHRDRCGCNGLQY